MIQSRPHWLLACDFVGLLCKFLVANKAVGIATFFDWRLWALGCLSLVEILDRYCAARTSNCPYSDWGHLGWTSGSGNNCTIWCDLWTFRVVPIIFSGPGTVGPSACENMSKVTGNRFAARVCYTSSLLCMFVDVSSFRFWRNKAVVRYLEWLGFVVSVCMRCDPSVYTMSDTRKQILLVGISTIVWSASRCERPCSPESLLHIQSATFKNKCTSAARNATSTPIDLPSRFTGGFGKLYICQSAQQFHALNHVPHT